MSSDNNVEDYFIVENETHADFTAMSPPGASASSTISPDNPEAYGQLDALNRSLEQTNIQDHAMQDESITLDTSFETSSENSELKDTSLKGYPSSNAKSRHVLASTATGSPKKAKFDSGEKIPNFTQTGDSQSQANNFKQDDLKRLIELQKRLLKIDQQKLQDLISLGEDVEDLGKRLRGLWPPFDEFEQRVRADIEITRDNIPKLATYLKAVNDHASSFKDETTSVLMLEGEETTVLGADLQLTSQAQFASNANGSTNHAKEAVVVCLDNLMPAKQQSNPALGTTTSPAQQHPGSTNLSARVADSTGNSTNFSGKTGLVDNISAGLNNSADYLSHHNFPAVHSNESHIHSSTRGDCAPVGFTCGHASSGSSCQPRHGQMQQQVVLSGGDPLQVSGWGQSPQNNGAGVGQAQEFDRASSAQSIQTTRDVGVPSHQIQTGGRTSAATSSWGNSTSTDQNYQGPASGTHFLQESNQNQKTSTGQKTVTLLLVGSSGNGKSATGNSILSKQVFKRSASSSVQSATDASNIRMESTEIAGQVVNVIDGPGINDCGNLQSQDLEKIIGAMSKSLELCKFEFHALLIALKFGVRFTKQEVETIKLIRCLLGKDVIRDYGVCVITHGDNFESAVEEAKDFGEILTFDKWIQTQTGAVKDLLEECQNRYVLFDNATKDGEIRQKQIKELMAVLPKGKQYSLEEFGRAGEDQAKLRLQASLPELISQLTAKTADIRSSMNAVLERDHVTDIVTLVSKMAALLDEVCLLEADVEKKHAVELKHVALEIRLLKNDISTKITHSLKSKELKILERKQSSSNNTGSSGYQNKPDDYTFAVELPSAFSEEFLLHCDNAMNYSKNITDSNTRNVWLCIIKATLKKFVEKFRSYLDDSRMKQAKKLHQKVCEKLSYKDNETTAQQVVPNEKRRPREIASTTSYGNTDDRDRSYETPSKTPFAGGSAKDRFYDDSSNIKFGANSSSRHLQQSLPSQSTDESLALLSYPYHETQQVVATSSMLSIEAIMEIFVRRVGAWWNQIR